MSHPVVTVKTVENVGHVIELLRLTTYNGFPVVDPPLSDSSCVRTYGKIRGLILRSQLIVLLQRKMFNETSDLWVDTDQDMFRDEYPRYPNIKDINIAEREKTYYIDLRPFMNSSPYTVLHVRFFVLLLNKNENIAFIFSLLPYRGCISCSGL